MEEIDIYPGLHPGLMIFRPYGAFPIAAPGADIDYLSDFPNKV